MPIPRSPDAIADFDSASGMLRALARFLRGRASPALGVPGAEWKEPALGLLGAAVNALPDGLQRSFYINGGRSEAIRPSRLDGLDASRIARWAAEAYPRRRYPAVMIGSSNGAMVHLAAALGIPWLPQTILIPVRHPGRDGNDPARDMEWGRRHAHSLLEANPDLALHQMHDPNQDQLMSRRMSYFRVKWRRLPGPYLRFLDDRLEPGGTILLVECRLTWPTTRLGDRHTFQFGALGGLEPEEYRRDDPRIAAFLRRQGSDRRRWDAPPTDGESPEAEWGFDAHLRDDVIAFAERRGLRVRRVVFDRPEDLSPLVADLYRRLYADRGLASNRLMVESFVLLEPRWALRTGSVPFWTAFAVDPSARNLERYLDRVEPFDEIHATLFSHGVESVGVAPPDRWRPILDRAKRRRGFLGVDEAAFPRDFAAMVNFHRSIPRTIAARYPIPGPITLGRLDAFLAESGDRHRVRWLGPDQPRHEAPDRRVERG